MPNLVLIVDDDPAERRFMENLVERCGHGSVVAASGAAALSLLEEPGARFSAIILDLVMPDLDGMAVLSRLRGRAGIPPVIVHATPGGIDTVQSAVRAGAHDFILRPAGIERVAVALGNAFRFTAMQSALLDRPRGPVAGGLDAVTTGSPAMRRTLDLARRAAKTGLPVLLTGEPGAGKRRLSESIHAAGDRSDRPLVVFSAASESVARLRNAFEEARERIGTLLVADVDALCAEGQGLLARWFDGGHLAFSAGASAARRQAKLHATTRADLAARVRAGAFRDDLYMRLAVQPVPLPALRDRPEDIGTLAAEYAVRAGLETGRPVRGFTAEALSLIAAHDWPGNLRELDIAMHRAVLLADGDMIGPEHLPVLSGELSGPTPMRPRRTVPVTVLPPSGDDFVDVNGRPFSLAEIEASAIRRALERCSGHIGRAAAELGIGRSTLYRKARDLGIVSEIPDIPSEMPRDAA
jgi:DNA-binding NtrC family response regulator